MQIKDDKISGDVFVVAEDLFEAVKKVDSGIIYPDFDAADRDASGYTNKVFRVEVTIFEA
jgi:hypothetical protein